MWKENLDTSQCSQESEDGNGSRFPSALIGLNVEPIKEIPGVTLYVFHKNGEKNNGRKDK